MSLYGTMRTGVSGMNAQANRLSTVADNIANANTTGYKKASTQFSSLILPSTGGAYNSGGVTTDVRYSISAQGAFTYTTSATDLAINGQGFFLVQGPDGQSYLTRAGAFTMTSDGGLRNSAGFKLMGSEYSADGPPPPVVNSLTEGQTEIKLDGEGIKAVGSTAGQLDVNLPSNASVGYTKATSLAVYDTQGNTHLIDFTYEKTGNNEWSVETSLNGVPYGAGATMIFDANGQLDPPGFSITLPLMSINGADLGPLAIDMRNSTQLAADFDVSNGKINGNSASKATGFEISEDGIVFLKYDNGELTPKFRISMVSATSPDKLKPLPGNVYAQSIDAGDLMLSSAGQSGNGTILSGALEDSNVDIAEELTSMIEAQRNYTANSKVFQTGSELMDVLVNLKR